MEAVVSWPREGVYGVDKYVGERKDLPARKNVAICVTISSSYTVKNTIVTNYRVLLGTVAVKRERRRITQPENELRTLKHPFIRHATP